MTERRIVFLLFPGFQALDLTGPHEVFAAANEVLDGWGRDAPRYRCQVVAPAAGPVTTSSGLGIVAPVALAQLDARGIDTLLVVGGDGVYDATEDAALVHGLAEGARHARRVGSICSGTFLLAAAGLLDGRRVTTHWARARRLQRSFPAVHVDADPIHVRDGNVWTSAGVTAGIDLALALVEDDVGVDVAQHVARWLVMFLRRPGGQSQFAAPLWSASAEREPIRAAQDLIHLSPDADLSVPALARHAAMSERNFARQFRREVGCPPARYVEEMRVQAARRLLEQSTSTVEQVARSTGFGTAETMRRAFLRRVGVAPADYRQRFRILPPTPDAAARRLPGGGPAPQSQFQPRPSPPQPSPPQPSRPQPSRPQPLEALS